jgi:hypothetical protein
LRNRIGSASRQADGGPRDDAGCPDAQAGRGVTAPHDRITIRESRDADRAAIEAVALPA